MLPAITFKAPSAVALLDKLRTRLHSQHGGSVAAPQLTNGELMQLAEYFRAHNVSGWDKLARVALGFFKEGDKFQAGDKFSAAHARRPVGPEQLPGLWGRMAGMATRIDAAEGDAQEFTPSETSKSFWDFMAAGAFKILQAERARKTRARKTRDPRIIKPPPAKKPPPAPKPIRPGKFKIPTWALVVGALLLLRRKGR